MNGSSAAERRTDLPAAEAWFVRHGLPWFVLDVQSVVQRRLQRSRLTPVVLAAALLAAAAGVGTWLAGDDASGAITVGLLVAVAVLGLYAAFALRVRAIARWAVEHTLDSLGLLFPLATKALPLLLLFITFLFINTEVWMVAESLDVGLLAMAVMLFVLMASGFLLVRLPEELDQLDDHIRGERLIRACRGTPLEEASQQVVDGVEHERHVEVTGFEKANLILVLLVSQLVQVLLLSLAVCGFFLVFGTVVMQPDVVEAWIGHEPDALFGGLTVELVKVSVFLAGFSGLYFTVYAVTDDQYRDQFFTSITRELERAVAVRAVYQVLTR